MRLPGCGVVEVEIRVAVACRSELVKVGWLCVPPRRKRARDWARAVERAQIWGFPVQQAGGGMERCARSRVVNQMQLQFVVSVQSRRGGWYTESMYVAGGRSCSANATGEVPTPKSSGRRCPWRFLPLLRSVLPRVYFACGHSRTPHSLAFRVPEHIADILSD